MKNTQCIDFTARATSVGLVPAVVEIPKPSIGEGRGSLKVGGFNVVIEIAGGQEAEQMYRQ